MNELINLISWKNAQIGSLPFLGQHCYLLCSQNLTTSENHSQSCSAHLYLGSPAQALLLPSPSSLSGSNKIPSNLSSEPIFQISNLCQCNCSQVFWNIKVDSYLANQFTGC